MSKYIVLCKMSCYMQAHPELVLKAIEKNFGQLDLANFENLETQHTHPAGTSVISS